MIPLGKKYVFSLISIILFLAIWKIVSLLIGADIILPPPERVIHSITNIFVTENFTTRVMATLLRGFIGFIISYISGTIIGLLAGIFPLFRGFVQPIVSIIRSTPVISVILLALIWFNTDIVPIFVAYLMAFPIITANVIEGVTTVDKKLLDMARVYNIPLRKQIFHIYIPSILPFFIASASISLGIIWKVIIAAEVLSQPKWGIGTSLNEAKAFLLTEEVFAWTVMAILLSVGTDILFKLLAKLIPGVKNGN